MWSPARRRSDRQRGAGLIARCTTRLNRGPRSCARCFVDGHDYRVCQCSLTLNRGWDQIIVEAEVLQSEMNEEDKKGAKGKERQMDVRFGHTGLKYR